MGLLKQKQEMMLGPTVDPVTVPISSPGAGSAISSDMPLLPRKMRLTLTGALVSITAASDFGSVKVCDLPVRNMLLLAVEADLVLTKQGNTNGVVAGTTLDVAMGTAAASNTTLSAGMIDILEKVDVDTAQLVVDFERHSNDQATAVFPKRISDGANALYLNIVASNLITADSSVSASGSIDIYYIDLGKQA